MRKRRDLQMAAEPLRVNRAAQAAYIRKLSAIANGVHAEYMRLIERRLHQDSLFDGSLGILDIRLEPQIEQKVGAAFDAMRRGIINKSVFVEPGVLEAVKQARADNLAYFDKAMRAYGADVRHVLGELGSLTQPWEKLRDALVQRGSVSASRAALIARDQTTKLHGKVAQITQTNAGIASYIWVTSLDERVRPSHAEKEGQTFEWDSPPADTGHPGSQINCRCVALASL